MENRNEIDYRPDLSSSNMMSACYRSALDSIFCAVIILDHLIRGAGFYHIINRLKTLEDDSKRNSDQHREFYGKFTSLETRNAVTEERYSTILTTMPETKASIEELKSKPGKRWESVIERVILLIVAAVVGYALAQTRLG